MYFPSEEEQRFVLRRLLPEVREQGVAEELRGWAWERAPTRPIYDVPLAVYELAGKYCGSGRDVYLRRVLGLRAPPNRGMLDGRALHALVADLLVEAKRLIYQHGQACLEALDGLRHRPLPVPAEPTSGTQAWLELGHKMDLVRAFQARRIVQRVEDVLTRQPNAGPDAIAALALPASVELKLDGMFLGLSPHLSADAVLFAGAAVADLKFGPREAFHRLTTTGYALVLESLYERPVDIGCIVYAEVRKGRLTVERDYHIIGDELRQWFLQEREEKARLVAEELDPGLPAECPNSCPYLNTCHPSENGARKRSQRPPAAKVGRALALDGAALS
jgi:CRISPR-associated protein Csa1